MKKLAQHRFLSHLLSRKEDEGFTLVELIVVIIIMAILSQIGLVSFNRYTRRTRAFAAETAMRNIKRECEMNRDLGMDQTFTPLTPRGYSLQPDNSNSCVGGSSSELVTAIPDNQGEYPSYFYNFADGTIGCSYSNPTDNLFPECKNNASQSQSSVASGITDWKAYAAETAENFEEFSPNVKQASCETSWAGTSYTGKAEHATDGNPNTVWTCDGMASIDFDLGKKQEIRSVNVQFQGNVANGNYIKLYVDNNLVAEGTQPCCGNGFTWFIEPTEGQTIRYETVDKPHTLNLGGVEEGENPQLQSATWSEIGELTVNGAMRYRTNKGHYGSGTGVYCDVSWAKEPCD